MSIRNDYEMDKKNMKNKVLKKKLLEILNPIYWRGCTNGAEGGPLESEYEFECAVEDIMLLISEEGAKCKDCGGKILKQCYTCFSKEEDKKI